MTLRSLLPAAAILACAVLGACAGVPATAPLEGVPRYDHVFVIVEENKNYEQILNGEAAPEHRGPGQDLRQRHAVLRRDPSQRG